MAERFHIPTALWSVQADLLGGPRRLLAVGVGYLLLLTAASFGLHAIYRGRPYSVFAASTLNWLAGAQVFILLLGGANATYRAMLRDFDTRMLESHRLTPMSNVSVPLGYLIGANLQVLVLAAVGCVVGVVLSLLGSLPVVAWVSANFMVACAAIMIWSMVVFSGLRPAKPVSPSPFIVVTAMLTMGIMLIPGAGVFCGTYAVFLSASLISGDATFNAPSVLLMAGISLALALFWLRLSAVKYRRPDLPALNGSRGLLLFGLWCVIGTIGVLGYEMVTSRMFGALGIDSLGDVQWIATAALSLFVALVPVSGAVQCRLLIERGAAARDRWDKVSDLTVAWVAGGMLLAVMAVLGLPVWGNLPISGRLAYGPVSAAAVAWVMTAVVVFSGILAMRGLMVMLYARLKKPAGWLVALMLLMWGAPILVDLVLTEIRRGLETVADLSMLTGLSPLGTIMIVWSGYYAPVLPGVAIQVAAAALLTLGARRVRASRFLAGHCRRCGYNLTGNTTNRCPECGAEC